MEERGIRFHLHLRPIGESVEDRIKIRCPKENQVGSEIKVGTAVVSKSWEVVLKYVDKEVMSGRFVK